MKYKTRFAPSPTGLLHIGNARSAILNWIYAKKINGEFILRIDDTDKEKTKKLFEDKIKENLLKLGVNWSKTFNQSERKNFYDAKILQLKEEKKIYPCFETQEELQLKRKTLLSSGLPPIYDRSSLKLSHVDIETRIKNGAKHHWRYKIEDEIIEWKDLIKGKISFDSKNLSDPILIREDQTPLYHLPSVIDDIQENITDIIRGEDHITNTAFHIQLFKSLGANIPNFGHHPLLTDSDGKSLGKRLNSLSIDQLLEEDFESLTLVNYLLTIGTSKNLSSEKNIDKLIEDFDINSLNVSSPKFSIDILKILNKNILQSFDFSDVEKRFIKNDIVDLKEDFWNCIKYNINYFNESIDWFNDIFSEKFHKNESYDFLKTISKFLPEEPYDENSWDEWTTLIKKNTGKKGKDLYLPIRLALTGQDTGPELKDLLPLLSKNLILKKLGVIEK